MSKVYNESMLKPIGKKKSSQGKKKSSQGKKKLLQAKAELEFIKKKVDELLELTKDSPFLNKRLRELKNML